MNAPILNRERLWEEFLAHWPLERLSEMTLVEYTQRTQKDSFHWWLTNGPKLKLINGEGAVELAIYYRDFPTRRLRDDFIQNKNYFWSRKYGFDEVSAFTEIRSRIIKVASAARIGDFAQVEEVELGSELKWIIAFLYQDPQAPHILPIYSKDPLQVALGSAKTLSYPEMYDRLMAARANRGLFEYADMILAQANLSMTEQLSPEEVLAYFTAQPDRFRAIKPPTQYIAGFTMRTGQQIALVRDNKEVTLFVSPGKWLEMARHELGKIQDYPAGKSRNSNLTANAPLLALDHPAVMVRVPTKQALKALCEAYEDEFFQSMPMSTQDTNKMAMPPLNQILYGPPGTGKTYHTVNATLEILDPEFLKINADDRKLLKNRFDALVSTGQVEFVTFHQSFSYEDFVEGLRAEKSEEDGQLDYPVVDGVFKKLCTLKQEDPEEMDEALFDLAGRQIWKMSLGSQFGEDSHIYSECISNSMILLGWGEGLDFSACKNKTDIVHTFKAAGHDYKVGDYAVTAVESFLLKMQPNDLVIASAGNYKFKAIGEVIGDYECLDRSTQGGTYGQSRKIRWLRVFEEPQPRELIMSKDFMMKAIYQLRPHVLQHGKLQVLLVDKKDDEETRLRQLPRVLVIDEINRGNISRIFGELITLIEPSKRTGAEEALEVTLPYSKVKFSVPDNVYIIGTMNTSDRSLAGLDIALRRRFTFREISPEPELLDSVQVDGINIGKLLRIMNQRIEVLLDRDHCLGHAYFLPLKNEPTLKKLSFIFRQQVLPLLQEYFFEDWERMAWVLNDQNKSLDYCFVTQPSANLEELFGTKASGKLQDRRWTINKEAFARIESYQGILGAQA